MGLMDLSGAPEYFKTQLELNHQFNIHKTEKSKTATKLNMKVIQRHKILAKFSFDIGELLSSSEFLPVSPTWIPISAITSDSAQ